jgi:DNA (cytosine-5)-methyltransferase 1
MENVKGMLSSSLDNSLIFGGILNDLRNAGSGYRLLALASRNNEKSGKHGVEIDPRDFIIYAEDFGLPQARHRWSARRFLNQLE